MEEKDVECEAHIEFTKKTKELVKDVIREANTLPKDPAGKDQNLDIIKHLIKRLAVHQIILEDKAKKTNILLIVLSIIMALGALFSILTFFFSVMKFFFSID